jgi:hypothetical protein
MVTIAGNGFLDTLPWWVYYGGPVHFANYFRAGLGIDH